MFNKNKKDKLTNLQEIFGIKIVDKYTNLGVTLDAKGLIENWFKKIKAKLIYLKIAFSKILYNTDENFRNRIWGIFMRPHFLYVCGIMET